MITGGVGYDRIDGGFGRDTIYANDGVRDVIITDGRDRIVHDEGLDEIITCRALCQIGVRARARAMRMSSTRRTLAGSCVHGRDRARDPQNTLSKSLPRLWEVARVVAANQHPVGASGDFGVHASSDWVEVGAGKKGHRRNLAERRGRHDGRAATLLLAAGAALAAVAVLAFRRRHRAPASPATPLSDEVVVSV